MKTMSAHLSLFAVAVGLLERNMSFPGTRQMTYRKGFFMLQCVHKENLLTDRWLCSGRKADRPDPDIPESSGILSGFQALYSFGRKKHILFYTEKRERIMGSRPAYD